MEIETQERRTATFVLAVLFHAAAIASGINNRSAGASVIEARRFVTAAEEEGVLPEEFK